MWLVVETDFSRTGARLSREMEMAINHMMDLVDFLIF